MMTEHLHKEFVLKDLDTGHVYTEKEDLPPALLKVTDPKQLLNGSWFYSPKVALPEPVPLFNFQVFHTPTAAVAKEHVTASGNVRGHGNDGEGQAVGGLKQRYDRQGAHQQRKKQKGAENDINNNNNNNSDSGIYNGNGDETTTIIRSTEAGNSSGGLGGGLMQQVCYRVVAGLNLTGAGGAYLSGSGRSRPLTMKDGDGCCVSGGGVGSDGLATSGGDQVVLSDLAFVRIAGTGTAREADGRPYSVYLLVVRGWDHSTYQCHLSQNATHYHNHKHPHYHQHHDHSSHRLIWSHSLAARAGGAHRAPHAGDGGGGGGGGGGGSCRYEKGRGCGCAPLTWTVYRRFRHFAQLDTQLRAEGLLPPLAPSSSSILPASSAHSDSDLLQQLQQLQLPPKRFMGVQFLSDVALSSRSTVIDKELIAQRRVELEAWLAQILDCDHMYGWQCEGEREVVGEGDDDRDDGARNREHGRCNHSHHHQHQQHSQRSHDDKEGVGESAGIKGVRSSALRAFLTDGTDCPPPHLKLDSSDGTARALQLHLSLKQLVGGVGEADEDGQAGGDLTSSTTSSSSASSCRQACTRIIEEDGDEASRAAGGESEGGGDEEGRAAVAGAKLEDWEALRVIGKGSFGKVMLVRRKGSGRLFAMKTLDKQQLLTTSQVEHALAERRVLGLIDHPFIVGMHFAFQCHSKLYLVLDYLAGGELFFHLSKRRTMPAFMARFYVAELVLAIECLHSHGIIYRDLKPENVLLDASGHVKLADFGLCKEGVYDSVQGARSLLGTPEYLSPEMLSRKGHGSAVDWWGLGMVLYELLLGLPPWYTEDRKLLFRRLKHGELVFPSSPKIPKAAKDLIGQLLIKDPRKRLGTAAGATQTTWLGGFHGSAVSASSGSGGVSDSPAVKAHPFFRSVDWHALFAREVMPPFCPCQQIKTVSGSHNFDKTFTDMRVSMRVPSVRAPGPGAGEEAALAAVLTERQNNAMGCGGDSGHNGKQRVAADCAGGGQMGQADEDEERWRGQDGNGGFTMFTGFTYARQSRAGRR